MCVCVCVCVYIHIYTCVCVCTHWTQSTAYVVFALYMLYIEREKKVHTPGAINSADKAHRNKYTLYIYYMWRERKCTHRARSTARTRPIETKKKSTHRARSTARTRPMAPSFGPVLASSFKAKTCWKHVSNTLATRLQHVSNTLATRWQHVGNTLATR